MASALEAAGFKVNPTLKSYYANDTSEIGHEDTTFNGQVRNSFSLYKDAAFIVLSREGGEGSDAERVTSETVKGSEDDHKALLKKTASGGGEGPVAYAEEDEYYKHSLMLTESRKNAHKPGKGTVRKGRHFNQYLQSYGNCRLKERR